MAYGAINVEQMTTQSGYTLGAGNASSFKNRIINGAMVIDQRNAGASVTPADGAYTVDRWKYNLSQASKFTSQQSTTAPTGFSNSLLSTVSSAYSIGAGDYFMFSQRIEGFNFADMNWGTANAVPVTLSFWVRSSLTGTFGGSLQNSAENRSYPFTYSISSANTWEQKTVTIAGDTSGTWVGATNGAGLKLWLGLGVGSTYSGTAGAWAGSTYYSATGATSVVGTNGATFYITGVQLEVGTVATSFDYRSYGNELALCQRYYAKLLANASNLFVAFGSGFAQTSTAANIYVKYPQTMRSSPTANFNLIAVNDNSVQAGVTSFGGGNIGFDSALLSAVTASVLTVNRPVLLLANNSASGYVDFSAEL